MAKPNEQQQPQKQSAPTVSAQNRAGGVQRYFKEVRSEINKVIWPTREQALRLTAVVFVVMVLLAVFLAVFDLLASGAIQLILGV